MFDEVWVLVQERIAADNRELQPSALLHTTPIEITQSSAPLILRDYQMETVEFFLRSAVLRSNELFNI
jgi:hypothetical protein